MPGLTAPLTAPHEAAIRTLLESASDELSHEEIVQQFKQYEAHPGSAEIAFREEFYNILDTYDIDDDGFSVMWDLLDIVNATADARICGEAGFVFLLIEELLDSQTIHGCRKVFDFLDTRRDQYIKNNWQQKSLPLLRSCNELLRRLSRAEDTIFCGRVFIFLFQSFPLGDKSSVNLRGEYHSDNVTTYDKDGKDVPEPEAMAVDDVATPATSVVPTITVDGVETIDTTALYSTFWSLQEFFAQPTKLFDAENLTSFKAGLNITLKKFQEVYKDEPKVATRSEEQKGTKRKLDNLDGNAYNPKYLTSRDMFELEIHDTAFRRHILVQSLIVADFLLSQTPKAKARRANMKNKAVIYEFTLDEENTKWATEMRADIATYLQQGTEGKFYYRMVDNVLSRDKNWLRWKLESCPPFQLPAVKPEEFDQARITLQKATAPRQIRKAPMGALDLAFLQDHNQSDPLEKYRDSARWQQPDLLGFRDEIATVEMDMDFATEEEKEDLEEQKSSAIWRALRVGGRFGLLDKLDMESRDGLDPLFGIHKEPAEGKGDEEEKAEGDGDGEGDGENENDITLEAPAAAAQPDGAADGPTEAETDTQEAPPPEETREAEATQADEMEGQEVSGEANAEAPDQVEAAEEETSVIQETRSMESSLSPPPSFDGPLAENTAIATTDGEEETPAA